VFGFLTYIFFHEGPEVLYGLSRKQCRSQRRNCRLPLATLRQPVASELNALCGSDAPSPPGGDAVAVSGVEREAVQLPVA